MFSGIVETIAIVKHIDSKETGKKIILSPNQMFTDLSIGDSIAVNGVCLTITDINENDFSVFVVPETLRKTNIAKLTINSPVNLERSLRVDARISGHFVQGHIDNTGTISDIQTDGDGIIVTITLANDLIKYLINKGFISIDGMSITLIDVGRDWFSVTLIPHTREVTIARNYQIGSIVNIEIDMFAKYIERFVNKETLSS